MEPKTLKCFAGLCDSAVPVRVGENLVAFLQTGQILLRLSGSDVEAQQRATADQVYALEALQARLLAEMEGRGSFSAPDDFRMLTGADAQSAASAMQVQQHEFASRAAELSTQKAVLGQRIMRP